MWTWSFRGTSVSVPAFSQEHRAGSGLWSPHHGGKSLLLASMAVSGGFADRAVAMTSSHFASSGAVVPVSLGYGGQRTPIAQWTVGFRRWFAVVMALL